MSEIALKSDRLHSRQEDLLPPNALGKVNAVVVGVGAVGRQVALQLSAIGVRSLTLIDFDRVEDVNLRPQGYRQSQLGMSKVEATANDCEDLGLGVEILEMEERFTREASYWNSSSTNCLFCCVDSITAREFIWKNCRKDVQFFCDARVGGESIRVISVTDPEVEIHYPTTLFKEEEAFQGRCTGRMTVYFGNLAAGLMLEQWSKFLRGMEVEKDLTLNLLAMELGVDVR